MSLFLLQIYQEKVCRLESVLYRSVYRMFFHQVQIKYFLGGRNFFSPVVRTEKGVRKENLRQELVLAFEGEIFFRGRKKTVQNITAFLDRGICPSLFYINRGKCPLCTYAVHASECFHAQLQCIHHGYSAYSTGTAHTARLQRTQHGYSAHSTVTVHTARLQRTQHGYSAYNTVTAHTARLQRIHHSYSAVTLNQNSTDNIFQVII